MVACSEQTTNRPREQSNLFSPVELPRNMCCYSIFYIPEAESPGRLLIWLLAQSKQPIARENKAICSRPLSYRGIYAVILSFIFLKRNLLGDYSYGCLLRANNQSPARTKQFVLAR